MFISNCYVSDHILYSKCSQLADTLASSCCEKSFTPLTTDFCSKAVQICCSASWNLGIVLGIATCLWLLQAAKMWVNLMVYAWCNFWCNFHNSVNVRNHELLLRRLEQQSGLRGVVLEWFQSYLSGRTFHVIFGGCTSSIIYIVCSVPQGVSAWSTVVHCVHSWPSRHSREAWCISTCICVRYTVVPPLSSHRYDISCCPTERCIADVSHWMSAYWLKLNMDKTELLWVWSRRCLSQLSGYLPVLQLGPDSIAACDHVRLLGIMILSDLSLDRHVSTVSASGFYWLHQLWRSRR